MTWTPISKAYVYAMLGSTPRPLGVLAKRDDAFLFAYAESWLAAADAFSVDPLNLPLGTGTRSSRKMWGCFDDSTPDAWGRKVLFSTHRQKPSNEIEWLLATRGAGVGCLLFSASRSQLPTLNQYPDFADLAEMLRLADEIDRGEQPMHEDERLAKLLWHGSSMGGARPKITVWHEGREWIAKLMRRDDLFDQPRAEFASLGMARAAGIPVPEHQLHDVGGRSVLLLERFDRTPAGRQHYLSANALIAPERVRVGDPDSAISYLRLAEVIQKVSHRARDDMRDLYRRMAFNIAISNTDDHLKNHGFLRVDGNDYRLSPAFDLLPHPEQTAELALVAGRHGRAATFENALSAHERFGLSREEAHQVVAEVLDVTNHAAQWFREAGVRSLEVGMLAACCKRHGMTGSAPAQVMVNTTSFRSSSPKP